MSEYFAEPDLADPWWRLNNLYYIKNKKGKKELFKPNWAQKFLYNNMHYLSIILKARQLGMTTFIQLFMLDRCLFNDNTNAGVVAHNKDDAEAFFADKIKFAYDNLPDDLRQMRSAKSNTARSLEFDNGSRIRVGTSMRSGTYQYLHISEFGKMCAKYPDKAAEVITGTLNTIEPGQIAFIESTAEGPFGEFFDMCQTAETLKNAIDAGDTQLSMMDWKFFFFPWWEHPDYVLHEKVDIPENLMLYFKELREEQGIDLRPEQKAWYVKKAAEQAEKMKQEYPSTSAEAFERSTELSIYGKQLREARRERRICKLPLVKGIPVNTFWDLGRNDNTAIWFHQHVEARHHFVYYLEGRLEDPAYYVEQLANLRDDLKWYYGKHYLPHDANIVDVASLGGKSRKEIYEECGLSNIVVVPRCRSENDAIDNVRHAFSEYWFDAEGCERGLQCLHGFEWTWDELNKTTRQTPARNWAKHGADALRQHTQGFKGRANRWRDQSAGVDGNVGRKYARGNSRRGTITNPTTDHVV